jgi:hypothetical protein
MDEAPMHEEPETCPQKDGFGDPRDVVTGAVGNARLVEPTAGERPRGDLDELPRQEPLANDGAAPTNRPHR